MIAGTGIDLVDIDRVRTLLRRHGERALRRFFTPDEIAFCHRNADPAPCFAARLAAKEAALKALGTGQARGLRWRDIEIRREPDGGPTLHLSGAALERARTLGITRAWLSLSHERGHACALVVLEATAS
jgi:holo-[acyl-carrier protein] synthase